MHEMTCRQWDEYDAAAQWCAERGIKGDDGDALPTNLDARVEEEIAADTEAFRTAIRDHAYARAMNALDLPADVPDAWEAAPAPILPSLVSSPEARLNGGAL